MSSYVSVYSQQQVTFSVTFIASDSEYRSNVVNSSNTLSSLSNSYSLEKLFSLLTHGRKMYNTKWNKWGKVSLQLFRVLYRAYFHKITFYQ